MAYNVSRLVYSQIYEFKKYYNVHLIATDTKENRKNLQNKAHNICFVKVTKSKPINHILYLKTIIKETKRIRPDLILVHIFKLSYILPLIMPRHNLVLKFYHFDVNKNFFKRVFGNIRRFITIMLYEHISYEHDVIPRWILKIKKNIKYIPAGFNRLSDTHKNFKTIELLYIGSLDRNINSTIKGFSQFVNDHESLKGIKYHIIGDGSEEIKLNIRKEIKQKHLGNNIFYHGRLNDEEIVPFFDHCNIGVSFVPITSYYTNNIVTKTYEYLLSGMAVIGTATNANKKIINENNGILIQDTPESFFQGLKTIFKDRDKFNSSEIRSHVESLSNENVIKQYWVNYLNTVISS